VNLDFGAVPHPNLLRRPLERWLERALNLNTGDFERGTRMAAYLFLTITSYVVGKVARDALFLARFRATQLPYVDIATAVLVGFVVAACVRLGQRRTLGSLLTGTALFFSANCLVLWVLVHYCRFPWLYPLFYIWVGIFGVLAPAQVWTLANFVFTTREARRMFGLVGSGAILGWIFAGLFSRVFVQAFGTDSLLLLMTALLAASAVLAHRVSKDARPRPSVLPGSAQPPEDWRDAARLWSSAYVRSLAALVLLSSVVTTLVGWQFKAVAQEALGKQDALAIFFGNFNFYAGLLSLAVQLLVTARLLRRFGTGPALFVVPLALLGGAAGLLLTGALAAAVALKGSDQVLRYSIDRSTVELLYLPLPSRTKLHVKWFIDTVVWRFGDGIAGIAVLVLATRLADAPRQLSWAVMAAIAGWLMAALAAYRRYGETLADSIRRHRLEVESSAAVLERNLRLALDEKLRSENPDEVLYALQVLGIERRPAPRRKLHTLLSHPSAPVRCRTLGLLAEANDAEVLPQAELMLSDPDLCVRTEALLFLCGRQQFDPLERIQQLGDFADFSIRAALATYLARSGPAQNLLAAQRLIDDMAADGDIRTRVEAARVLHLLRENFEDPLRRLMGDPDPEVAREAIRAAGARRCLGVVPELMRCLGQDALCEAAAESLRGFGEAVVPALRDCLLDSQAPLPARRRIPALLVEIGTDEAWRALEPQLLESDTGLRYATLQAIHKLLGERSLPLDRAMLESVLEAEVMGHYRSYQILHALSPGGEHDLARALRESMSGEHDRIFHLLGLLHPAHDFNTACFGLQSKSASVHDSALEFLEHTLRPRWRELLIPLLDPQYSVAERALRGAQILGVAVDTREQAAAELLASGDPGLRWCGAYAVGRFGLRELMARLEDCAGDPDPLLRAAAQEAKSRLALSATASSP
jgi:AAA family ATP:ADP antiporter